MFDLHCHYLPGVDDGARDLESALALARASVANGIEHAVLTPHVFEGRWPNRLSNLRERFAAYRAALRAAGIPLQVSLGGEVHLLPGAFELAETDDLPLIGGWQGRRVMLLELPDGHIPVGALKAVERFLALGLVPMIAHPERNKAVMRQPRAMKPFIEAGCLLQLTAASICGAFGRPAFQCAHDLLEAGAVSVVATDAHNLAHRPPMLAEARFELAERYGQAAAELLTRVNPRHIVDARAGLGLDETARPAA